MKHWPALLPFLALIFLGCYEVLIGIACCAYPTHHVAAAKKHRCCEDVGQAIIDSRNYRVKQH